MVPDTQVLSCYLFLVREGPRGSDNEIEETAISKSTQQVVITLKFSHENAPWNDLSTQVFPGDLLQAGQLNQPYAYVSPEPQTCHACPGGSVSII